MKIWQKFLVCATMFTFICVCGLITAVAGGVKWGTADAACAVAVTLFLAFCFTFWTVPWLEGK